MRPSNESTGSCDTMVNGLEHCKARRSSIHFCFRYVCVKHYTALVLMEQPNNLLCHEGSWRLQAQQGVTMSIPECCPYGTVGSQLSPHSDEAKPIRRSALSRASARLREPPDAAMETPLFLSPIRHCGCDDFEVFAFLDADNGCVLVSSNQASGLLCSITGSGFNSDMGSWEILD
ncbi:hypothetical protein BDW22DRAFT_1191172 [Trametopsis cervina]|nr:hypothetical protein BDW22DRAFT_1191172 [Trametopsis cervina]